MLVVELTEKDLLTLQMMLDTEIRDNENKIIKIREHGGTGCYVLIDALKDRNILLERVKGRLQNTKMYKEELQ